MNEIIGRAPDKFYILIPIFLNMLVNLLFLILDIIKIAEKTDKIKMTSLEKFLFPVSIIEIMNSLFFCISAFLPFNDENFGESSQCKAVGCFQIYFYILELLLIYVIISHLKHLILNPLNYILKSNKKLITSLLICGTISLVITLICYFGELVGKSPMITCFFQYEFLFEDKIFPKILLIIILIVPLFIIGHIIYKIFIVIKSNPYKNDVENKELFKAHIFYLFFYLLTFIFVTILYITRALKSKSSDLSTFTFIMSLFMVICPLILGILKLYKNKIKKFSNKNFKSISLSSNKSIGLLEIDDCQEEQEQSEQFEASAIKKFVMNFYISVCFCLEKNLFGSYLLFKDLNDDSINETNKYKISQDIITKELPGGELIKDTMVNSRENFEISCVEYAPKIFSYLRQLDKVPEDMIITSMLPMNNKSGIKETEGKGGSFFINSDDYEFIMKTITEAEFKIMVKLLQNKMVDYFRTNNNSLICRIYGVYKISIQTGIIKNDEIYFILMKNVIGSFYDNLLCKYDLKGSRLNRKVQSENVDKDVLKDINFNEVEEIFLLNKDDSKKLLDIVEKDSNFLCSSGIMDYSLLVAKISLNNYEINSLFGKNHRKKTEAQYLQMIGKDRETISYTNTIRESKEINNNKEEEKEDEITNDENDKIRFKEGKIASLKKYMFPSLKGDIVYIMSIIDYFQIFNLQKNLENKYKKFKTGAKKEEISSIPPDEYKDRFIEFVKRKTDSEQFLRNMFEPKNKNDFE